ncbi:DUF3015 family protein [Vibrio sp. SCSIO 43137]|uniref:DUF3015 family protein n=1 Tax=Vibrio sp. SCSIO 43137 TaxID=3021011 RepID=UPI002307DF2A|nr:DUF3015 family protein [Vibrio sp. SCSIO 43137]WCE31423.1 DUF3015 family protein [Vibrio sp. SCSIO 43137]
MRKAVLLFIFFLAPQLAQANYLKECGTGQVLAGKAMDGYLAVTLNISSSTSDASTSRLSSPELCGKSLWSAARFINTNLPMIEQDTAMGSGEHLTAVLDMLECTPEARPTIVNSIRSDYSDSVTNSNYLKSSHNKKVESYFNIVRENVQSVPGQCKAV